MTNGALGLLALHHMQRVLDDEVGRPHVDIHHRVKEFRLGVPDRAAVGDPGRIDHCVDPAKCLVRGRYDLARVVHACEIGFNKNNFDTLLFQIGLDPRAILFIASGDHNAFAAAVGKEMGNGLAETLGGTGYDGDLAIHGKLGERIRIHHDTFTGLPDFHDSVAASASFCACKPSWPLGRDDTPFAMPSMKWFTSLA